MIACCPCATGADRIMGASIVTGHWGSLRASSWRLTDRARSTDVASPETKGFCECFHRAVKEELFQVAFRKNVYGTLDQLILIASWSSTIGSAPIKDTVPRNATLYQAFLSRAVWAFVPHVNLMRRRSLLELTSPATGTAQCPEIFG
jgi:hypothetical protein